MVSSRFVYVMFTRRLSHEDYEIFYERRTNCTYRYQIFSFHLLLNTKNIISNIFEYNTHKDHDRYKSRKKREDQTRYSIEKWMHTDWQHRDFNLFINVIRVSSLLRGSRACGD